MNSQTPVVSVITCFLNEERFLAEAIKSVVQQDYKDWELILVDDGSSDESKNIALRYVAEYKDNIFYFEHPNHQNKGVCASRNLAVSKARGTWLGFLDADDVWLPTKLSAQMAIVAQNNEVAMVCEASEYWWSWEKNQKTDVVIEVGNHLSGVYAPPKLIQLLYPFGPGAAPCPSAILLKKEACQRVNGFEESFTGIFQLYEDQAFLCKLYLQEKVFLSPDCHNRYRQRKGSCVWDTKDKYHVIRKHFLHWFGAYLKRQHVQDPLVHEALKKALAPYTGFPGLVNTFKRTVKQKLG